MHQSGAVFETVTRKNQTEIGSVTMRFRCGFDAFLMLALAGYTFLGESNLILFSTIPINWQLTFRRKRRFQFAVLRLRLG